MSFSNKLNSISQIISLGNAVNKAELNSSVLGFAKYKMIMQVKKLLKVIGDIGYQCHYFGVRLY